MDVRYVSADERSYRGCQKSRHNYSKDFTRETQCSVVVVVDGAWQTWWALYVTTTVIGPKPQTGARRGRANPFNASSLACWRTVSAKRCSLSVSTLNTDVSRKVNKKYKWLKCAFKIRFVYFTLRIRKLELYNRPTARISQ